MLLNKLNTYLLYSIVIIILLTCMHIIFSTSSSSKESFTNYNNIALPQILYINLANRTDRKKQILEELEKLKLDNTNTNTKTKIHRIDAVYMPKNGHKGCVQSHIKALKYIKSTSSVPYALILEDDFELAVSPDEFKAQITKIITTLEKRQQAWDVIMLATAYATKEPLEGSDDIVRIRKSTTSSAYIIKREYIDILLACFMDCDSHMSADKVKDPKNGFEDYALDQQWAKLQKRDNWFGFKEDLSKQRAIWSSIQTGVHENIRLISDQNTYE
jgi:glycosyl transferase family 25